MRAFLARPRLERFERLPIGNLSGARTTAAVGGLKEGSHVPDQSQVRFAIRPNGGGTTHIAVEGALTREGNLERLRAAITDVRVEEYVHEIQIDLMGATAIDLQGIGVLLAMRDECERRGVGLVIANPQGSVRSRLEQTGTLEYLRGRLPPDE
jgi:anti-anti-sigma regulatory factor